MSRLTAWFGLVSVLMVFSAGTSAADLPPQTISLLSTKAQRVNDAVMFTKWTKAITRHNLQMTFDINACSEPKNESCFLREWDDELKRIERQPKRIQLELINKYMNANPYVLDSVRWGVSDYWEAPLEFMMFSGDCEDYAIAKFFSLIRLGFSNDDMQIVIVQDQNLKEAHAILAITFEGANYILDNQIPQVVRDSLIHHYTPMYGLNLTGWWRFSARSNALMPSGLVPKP